MPDLLMEVGCPRIWGLELPTQNTGSKSTSKACPTHNPAMRDGGGKLRDIILAMLKGW